MKTGETVLHIALVETSFGRKYPCRSVFGECLKVTCSALTGDFIYRCCCFQYIIIPPRRATAGAAQILVSHLLGDAGSPWLVGEVRRSITLLSISFEQFFRAAPSKSRDIFWLNFIIISHLSFN